MKSTRLENAEHEFALGNGDEANDRFVTLEDHNVLARQRRLDEPRELGLGKVNRDVLHRGTRRPSGAIGRGAHDQLS